MTIRVRGSSILVIDFADNIGTLNIIMIRDEFDELRIDVVHLSP